MEIKTEVVEDLKELSQEQKDKLAQKIQANFTKWDDDREAQINIAREIMEETYLNQPKKNFGKGFEWKSDVKLNGLYNIKRARLSTLWREMWSNSSQMFDVRGTNDQTEQMAKQQKASLVDALEKMNIGKQMDDGANNLFDIGEIIFKTDWVAKKKIVKRQNKNVGWILQNVVSMMSGAGYTTVPMKDVEVPLYENARVESISPFMFVFDHTQYKLKDKDSWDSIMKIYKRFDTLDNIKNNKVYKLTAEQIDNLKSLHDEEGNQDNKELVDLRDEEVYGGKIAILYAHGDFKVNGKTYKNYIAEVVGGKYLVRFEENPMYINPFILCALEFDPLTKRGITPLKSTKDMLLQEERLTNLAFDVQALTCNPPSWADENLLDEENTEKDGTIKLAPGKFIPVKNGFNGQMPVPYTISANGISDLLAMLDQKISELSSVSAVSFGNIEAQKRTATELSLADKGATAQSSKEMDIINQDLILPMIENVAELLAMFKDGVDYVYAEEKGANVEYRITNEIRQAEYNYIYEDRNAMADRKNKVNELFQLFQAVGQSPELSQMIDWKETITTYVECIGFDNPDKFFADETPAQQFANQLKQIPQELQGQVVGQFSQELQQMTQAYQQQQQQAQMQAQAQNQVQMDMYRQQARANAEQEMAQQMGVM